MEGTKFLETIMPYVPQYQGGQCADYFSSYEPKPYGGAGFRSLTGGSNGLIADVTYNMASALNLLPDPVPSTRRFRVSNFQLAIHGNVSWAGGTAVILQDEASHPLAYFPLISLVGMAQYNMPANAINKTLIATVSSYAAATGIITLPSSTLITTTLALTPFRVVSGTGKGQTGIISANTATTITPVGGALTTALDNTSVIEVFYYVATATSGTTISASNAGWTDHTLNQGFSVVIISGTGAGQVRPITDNSATQITVGTWDTTPDTTSIFLVTKNPGMMGAVDLAIGQLLGATGLGKRPQIALQGSFTGPTSSPIRAYIEGFFTL